MMVSVDSFEGFSGHTEETGGIPDGNAALHQPGCTGVPENVRRYIGKRSPLAGSGEPALDVLQSTAAFVDDEPQFRSPLPGPTQMAHQLRRNRDASSALVRSTHARFVEIDATVVEINLRPAQRQNCLFAMASVKSQKNKQWQVQPYPRLTKRGLK